MAAVEIDERLRCQDSRKQMSPETIGNDTIIGTVRHEHGATHSFHVLGGGESIAQRGQSREQRVVFWSRRPRQRAPEDDDFLRRDAAGLRQPMRSGGGIPIQPRSETNPSLRPKPRSSKAAHRARGR